MTGVFLNNWSTLEEMKMDFWYPDNTYRGELEGARVLLASYGTPGYEGYAFVLFERAGTLYEVNASHCSCYGLEGQWEPEETTVEAIRHRVTAGELGSESYEGNPFSEELLQTLDAFIRNKERVL